MRRRLLKSSSSGELASIYDLPNGELVFLVSDDLMAGSLESLVRAADVETIPAGSGHVPVVRVGNKVYASYERALFFSELPLLYSKMGVPFMNSDVKVLTSNGTGQQNTSIFINSSSPENILLSINNYNGSWFISTGFHSLTGFVPTVGDEEVWGYDLGAINTYARLLGWSSYLNPHGYTGNVWIYTSTEVSATHMKGYILDVTSSLTDPVPDSYDIDKCIDIDELESDPNYYANVEAGVTITFDVTSYFNS